MRGMVGILVARFTGRDGGEVGGGGGGGCAGYPAGAAGGSEDGKRERRERMEWKGSQVSRATVREARDEARQAI